MQYGVCRKRKTYEKQLHTADFALFRYNRAGHHREIPSSSEPGTEQAPFAQRGRQWPECPRWVQAATPLIAGMGGKQTLASGESFDGQFTRGRGVSPSRRWLSQTSPRFRVALTCLRGAGKGAAEVVNRGSLGHSPCSHRVARRREERPGLGIRRSEKDQGYQSLTFRLTRS